MTSDLPPHLEEYMARWNAQMDDFYDRLAPRPRRGLLARLSSWLQRRDAS